VRFLLACPGCSRQFDVTGHAVGSRLSCSCGGVLTVPQPQGHDAAVVRCSSCGAPREIGAATCRFCSSEFTLHEKDLDTLCPGCMARVSRRARFCHGCGTPVLGAQASRPGTDLRCPSCPPRPEPRALASRRLGRANVAVFDCGVCGGLWVDREIFEVMVERARAGSLPELGTSGPVSLPPPEKPANPDGQAAYRPCVVCGALMHRRNYGKKSGIILDVCSRHGVWFDLHEMDRLLRWIREGGEERTRALEGEAAREAARRLERAKGVEPLRLTREDRRQELADGSLFGAVLYFLTGLTTGFGDLFRE